MGEVAVFALGFGVGALVSLAFFVVVRPWLAAVSSNVRVPLGRVIGMHLRRTPVRLLVDAHVTLSKRGYTVPFDLVETVYLANRPGVRDEQDLVSRVVEAVRSGERLTSDGP